MSFDIRIKSRKATEINQIYSLFGNIIVCSSSKLYTNRQRTECRPNTQPYEPESVVDMNL